MDKASFVRSACFSQRAVDRAEDITYLRSDQAHDRNHDNCDEHEDDRVLDQPLSPFFWME